MADELKAEDYREALETRDPEQIVDELGVDGARQLVEAYNSPRMQLIRQAQAVVEDILPVSIRGLYGNNIDLEDMNDLISEVQREVERREMDNAEDESAEGETVDA